MGVINRSSGGALEIRKEEAKRSFLVVSAPHGGSSQRWDVQDGYIENPAKRLRLDLRGGLESNEVIVFPANSGDNQQWRYDETSREIVNPCSRKVLDMHGEVRMPQEVRQLISADSDPIFSDLLDALFK